MNIQQQELYDRLESFEFDSGNERLTFAARLARENGWSLPFAHRVIEQYRRFLFLAVTAGHPVTPSDEVDQAWHLHLAYTRSYWDRLCGEVLRQPLHHNPTKGGAAEGQKYEACYEQTLASYRTHFGESPPTDIWPPASVRFAANRFQRIDLAGHWVVPKPWRRPSASLLGAVVLPTATVGGGFALLADATPGDIATIVFGLIFIAAIIRVLWRGGGRGKGRGGKGGGASGWFGCGTDGCSSGCGSGCGGGCAGGCSN